MRDKTHEIELLAPLAAAPPPPGSKYDRLIARAKEIQACNDDRRASV